MTDVFNEYVWWTGGVHNQKVNYVLVNLMKKIIPSIVGQSVAFNEQ